jgi:hypothetical protein
MHNFHVMTAIAAGLAKPWFGLSQATSMTKSKDWKNSGLNVDGREKKILAELFKFVDFSNPAARQKAYRAAVRDCVERRLPMVQSTSELLKPLMAFDDIPKVARADASAGSGGGGGGGNDDDNNNVGGMINFERYRHLAESIGDYLGFDLSKTDSGCSSGAASAAGARASPPKATTNAERDERAPSYAAPFLGRIVGKRSKFAKHEALRCDPAILM